MNKTMLSCKAICKSYRDGSHVTPVLHDVSLNVASHQMVAIVGSSGSGKSTLLHILGTLDQPDSGELWLAGKQVSSLSSEQKAQLRNEQLGFIYQFHHLLMDFTALENVAMIGKPGLVLADEPTGNLDHQTAESIYQLMRELNRELGTSFVVVTHDRALAAKLDQQYWMRDGRLGVDNG